MVVGTFRITGLRLEYLPNVVCLKMPVFSSQYEIDREAVKRSSQKPTSAMHYDRFFLLFQYSPAITKSLDKGRETYRTF